MDELEVGKLEELLRSSLQHVPAPEGFARRVKVRVAAREVRTEQPRLAAGAHRQAAWWTAVAAMLALAAGTDLVHIRHQRQAVAAQQQVDYAMQLTTHALDEVEMGVNRSPAGRFAQLLNETQR